MNRPPTSELAQGTGLVDLARTIRWAQQLAFRPPAPWLNDTDTIWLKILETDGNRCAAGGDARPTGERSGKRVLIGEAGR